MVKQKSKAEKELEALDSLFKALAHATRRHILIVLNARGGEMSAGEISSRFSCKWPTVTRHLQQLKQSGLISVQKRGREQLYTLELDYLCGALSNWLSWFSRS